MKLTPGDGKKKTKKRQVIPVTEPDDGAETPAQSAPHLSTRHPVQLEHALGHCGHTTANNLHQESPNKNVVLAPGAGVLKFNGP